MARGKKQIEGQLSFNFSLDTGNYVVQANDLVGGKQSLRNAPPIESDERRV